MACGARYCGGVSFPMVVAERSPFVRVEKRSAEQEDERSSRRLATMNE